MSLILSSNPAESNSASDAKENASRTTSASTTVTAEAEASFIKNSMFPLAASLGEVVFNGGHFNITINTMNKLPCICAILFLQHEATSESNELLNRRMATRAHHCSERLYHWLALSFFWSDQILTMNKICFKFYRATWDNFYAFTVTSLQVNSKQHFHFFLMTWELNIWNSIKEENVNMYKISALRHGEGTCTAFSRLLVCISDLSRSLRLLVRSLIHQKLLQKCRTRPAQVSHIYFMLISV